MDFSQYPPISPSLIAHASQATKDYLINRAKDDRLDSGYIYHLLKANGDAAYDPEKDVDNRTFRSRNLQFSNEIWNNKSYGPGLRLIWGRKKGKDDEQVHKSVLVLTGADADSYIPPTSPHTPSQKRKVIAPNFQDLITKAGITLQELSEKIQIHPETLQSFMNGTGRPRGQTTSHIASVMGISFNEVRKSLKQSRLEAAKASTFMTSSMSNLLATWKPKKKIPVNNRKKTHLILRIELCDGHVTNSSIHPRTPLT